MRAMARTEDEAKTNGVQYWVEVCQFKETDVFSSPTERRLKDFHIDFGVKKKLRETTAAEIVCDDGETWVDLTPSRRRRRRRRRP